MWLGQAGYCFTCANGLRIMIDPYLSNSLEEENGSSFHREVPILPALLNETPEVLIITHEHADHMDFGTLDVLLKNRPATSVLAPLNTWRTLRSRFGGKHNYIMFDQGIEVTIKGVLLRSVPASHSDEHAVGVIIDDGETMVYHTGDTMYRRDILSWIDCKPDAMIFPINGKGNNMNGADAARLVKAIRPAVALPMHWDMFKAYGCDICEFTDEMNGITDVQTIIPQHYEEFEITHNN